MSKHSALSTSLTFKKMLINGFTDGTGKKVPMEIFKITERSIPLNKLSKKLRAQDRDGGMMMGMYVVLGGLVAGVGTVIVYMVKDASSPLPEVAVRPQGVFPDWRSFRMSLTMTISLTRPACTRYAGNSPVAHTRSTTRS